MSMTASSMAAKIKAALAAAGHPVNNALAVALEPFCQGIIDEIHANAQVSGTVTGGAGAGGPVTGTVS